LEVKILYEKGKYKTIDIEAVKAGIKRITSVYSCKNLINHIKNSGSYMTEFSI
jgi:hypothetical protein